MAIKYKIMLLSSSMEITEIRNLNINDLVFSLKTNCQKPFIFSSQKYIYGSANPYKSFSSENKNLNDAFDELGSFIKEFRDFQKGPYTFNGGLVGTISYDGDDLINLNCYDPIIVIEKETGTTKLVSHKTEGYVERSEKLLEALRSDKEYENIKTSIKNISPNIGKDSYCSIIEKAKEYIASGDIYQINLSMDFEGTLTSDSIHLYKNLFTKHHSRFCYYIDNGDNKFILNSPERFLKLQGSTVTTEPIKGTRPRGKSEKEDKCLIEELKNSIKENAEHVMIVDMERNDLGKISEKSSVKVTDFKRIETYPALFHMTSTIKGTLKDTVTNIEAIKEMFPGGSITGAPKRRAREIIEELEKRQRGIYTGAVGWIDFNGDFDFAMAIRTAKIDSKNTINFSVGSGIVADSVPEEEYNESILKGSDFFNVTEQKETK